MTVVEWGEGLAEGLSEHRLEVDIRQAGYPAGVPEHADRRVVIIRSHGERWSGLDLDALRPSPLSSRAAAIRVAGRMPGRSSWGSTNAWWSRWAWPEG